ncbi:MULTISPECIES: hypothetical protein [Halorubrum]|uniref:Uncharacterized protein n=1 Tax=Halorubrum hochstenium ATCC 700873 TaxID=1227481 RepID=M0FD19_9EURY|nr:MULTISPECIES: hypothetical protein [Halorubrum]ELZ57238.1 hypothetical protein C467_06793 [Halorubrum hochstenium ATCC 700873]
MYAALYRLAVGAYLLWLGLVVTLVAGRYTPVPSFRIVHLGVVAGAAVLTLIGSGRLLRRGYGWVTRRLGERL